MNDAICSKTMNAYSLEKQTSSNHLRNWSKAVALLTLFFFSLGLQAQQITGKVEDENGSPLTGVVIKVIESPNSAISDIDGNYSIKLSDGEYTLEFSYFTYETLRRPGIKVSSKSPTILNVQLLPDIKELKEVVVTALNITREQRSLGYSAQIVDSAAINVAPSDNWISSLNGKVAGLSLNTTDGPMGTSEIILRGEKSLQLGNSGALVVIDGVPVSNDITGAGAGAYSSDNAPVDMGTSVGDVSPEDIASVTILKGAAATALYGSRGANGAVVITTKSGNPRQGVGISVSLNAGIENVNRYPDYQYMYGAGAGSDIDYYSYGATEDGSSTKGSSSAWGPKLNTGVQYFQYDPEKQGRGDEPTDWIAYPNNRKDYLRTGFKTRNSVSVEGGNKTTKARFSITNLQNKYILENTGYQRTSVNFSLSQRLNREMTISTKINYYNKSSDNLPTTGYSNKTASYYLMFVVPNADVNWYRRYWKIQDGVELKDIQQHRPFSSVPDNPYFALYEILNPMKRNGVFGNLSYNYKISPFWNFTAKTGIDMFDDISSNRQPMSSHSYAEGFYREQNAIRYEQNTDFLLSFTKPFENNIKLDASVGGNTMHMYYNRTRAHINRLLIPGEYTLANGVDRPVFVGYKEEKTINSLYAFTNFSFKDFLFLEATARNDWSSAFGTTNNSYFYPSVNLSLVLSELLPISHQTLPFAKLRVSYAEVGSDTKPYRNTKYYSSSNFTSSVTNPTTKANEELKPERTKSYEVGLEARFIKNRIGFDAAYYRADTYDQILSVPVEPSSGYLREYMNAGIVRNTGFELQVWAKPIVGKGYHWKVDFNGAVNRGKIIDLRDELEALSLYAMGSSGISLQAVRGGSIGDIYGLAYQRNEDGKIIYSGGVPQLTTEVQKVGSSVPKFKGGLGHEFKYKDWTVNVLFDGEFGHKKYSLSASVMTVQGKLKSTIPGREEGGILGDGVMEAADGSWRPNNVVVSPSVYYTAHYDRTNGEANMYDASYIKFREFRISKAFKSKQLERIGLKRASIGLYGRDLFIWTKWPGFDPQSSTLNDGTIVQGIEVGQLPSTRTMGINIKFSL